MTRLGRGLVVLGFVIALPASISSWPTSLLPFDPPSVGAQSAETTPMSMVDGGDEDVPTDSPPEAPTDSPTAIPTATPTVIPTATPTVIPTATPTAIPTVNPTTALQQVIQRSNDQQMQAIATRNLSLIADSLTDDYFRVLANTLQDMLDHKVSNITLLKLDWGAIVIAPDGASAVVTTYETWRIVSEAGSVDDEPHRNDYTVVIDNARWKIKADVQAIAPSQAPAPAVTPP
jgi:hypothetical protein